MVLVYFDVLFVLDFGGSEYVIGMVYVIEGGLIGMVSIIIGDMGDMGNSMI